MRTAPRQERRLVLSVGDDSSDEPCSSKCNASPRMSLVCHRWYHCWQEALCSSVLSGRAPEVFDLLNTLSRSAQRENRYFSSVDLPSAAKADAQRHLEIMGKGSSSANPSGASSSGPEVRDVFDPPNKEPFTAARKNSLTPENRAMSVGNLSLSSHGGASDSFAVNKKPGMLRTSSSAHLTMASYLETSTTTTRRMTAASSSKPTSGSGAPYSLIARIL